jgi:osmotically-inducible protein OsmY
MTIETRRFVRTMLLAAGLCGCASQHHRTETASDESAEVAARSHEHEHEAEDVRATPDDDEDALQEEHVAHQRGDGHRHDRKPAAEARLDDDDAGDEQTAPDNTARNERDREGDTLTPGDQSNTKGDLEITRRIRETVVDDDSLSFTAKNVKIITVAGKVTLRGPVNSQAERAAIEKKALAVAGAGQVVNELEVE